MPTKRLEQVEAAVRSAILSKISSKGDPQLHVERILISDDVAGLDLAYYCPDCKVWDIARAYITLKRRDKRIDK